jgi:hypothetical protein
MPEFPGHHGHEKSPETCALITLLNPQKKAHSGETTTGIVELLLHYITPPSSSVGGGIS